jgi:hypothetical protein
LAAEPKVPQDGLVVLRQQREAVGLVLRPGADMRRSQVAHIVHVETEQRAHLRLRQQSLGLGQALAAQAVEVDSLFPIDCHGSVSF